MRSLSQRAFKALGGRLRFCHSFVLRHSPLSQPAGSVALSPGNEVKDRAPESTNGFHRTHFVAPHLDPRADLVADFACASEALFMCASCSPGSGKLQCNRLVTPGKMGQRWALL